MQQNFLLRLTSTDDNHSNSTGTTVSYSPDISTAICFVLHWLALLVWVAQCSKHLALCFDVLRTFLLIHVGLTLKADSHIACRAHAVPLPCRAAKGLECVFPLWFTQCGRVWFTLAVPRPCHALTMPFFSRPRHSTAVERRPVGYLHAFGFFRLPRAVPRRLLSEAY
jgi:hypothetical protein